MTTSITEDLIQIFAASFDPVQQTITMKINFDVQLMHTSTSLTARPVQCRKHKQNIHQSNLKYYVRNL